MHPRRELALAPRQAPACIVQRPAHIWQRAALLAPPGMHSMAYKLCSAHHFIPTGGLLYAARRCKSLNQLIIAHEIFKDNTNLQKESSLGVCGREMHVSGMRAHIASTLPTVLRTGIMVNVVVVSAPIVVVAVPRCHRRRRRRRQESHPALQH